MASRMSSVINFLRGTHSQPICGTDPPLNYEEYTKLYHPNDKETQTEEMFVVIINGKMHMKCTDIDNVHTCIGEYIRSIKIPHKIITINNRINVMCGTNILYKIIYTHYDPKYED